MSKLINSKRYRVIKYHSKIQLEVNLDQIIQKFYQGGMHSKIRILLIGIKKWFLGIMITWDQMNLKANMYSYLNRNGILIKIKCIQMRCLTNLDELNHLFIILVKHKWFHQIIKTRENKTGLILNKKTNFRMCIKRHSLK